MCCFSSCTPAPLSLSRHFKLCKIARQPSDFLVIQRHSAFCISQLNTSGVHSRALHDHIRKMGSSHMSPHPRTWWILSQYCPFISKYFLVVKLAYLCFESCVWPVYSECSRWVSGYIFETSGWHLCFVVGTAGGQLCKKFVSREGRFSPQWHRIESISISSDNFCGGNVIGDVRPSIRTRPWIGSSSLKMLRPLNRACTDIRLRTIRAPRNQHQVSKVFQMYFGLHAWRWLPSVRPFVLLMMLGRRGVSTCIVFYHAFFTTSATNQRRLT